MLIEILDPTMDGTLKIINNKGESCKVITFETSVNYDMCEPVTITIGFVAYMDILGEEHE